jgi:DNA-binding CsgD family transcriptional regulator
VLETVGAQSEASLAFAGLHQLLRPVLDEVERLPAPQRDALHAAFGIIDEAAPDPFLIALATLNLLADLGTPVLVLADDAHWLDQASSAALVFVARRIASDSIIILAAARDGTETAFDEAGIPMMVLDRLDERSSAELLASRASDLPPSWRDRVLREAEGNPLALLELPLAVHSTVADRVARLPGRLPLTSRLEAAFAARAHELPGITREVVLLAAASDGDSAAEVLDAAGVFAGSPVAVDALAPAIAAKVVDLVDGVVRFQCPLMRSAIYQAAEAPRRLAVHAALAAVLADPDRRAWHRAASVLGTDEEAATDLDATAERAERRGAIAVAIAALERAARLSEDEARRGGRIVSAADLAFQLGQHDVLLRLLDEAGPLDVAPLDRARLDWLREWYAEGSWSGAERVAQFVEIAQQMSRHGDPARAMKSLLTVALRCYWSNPDRDSRELLVSAAEQIPLPADQPERLAVLAFAAPFERGAAVLDRLDSIAPDADADPEHLRLLGAAATAVGAWDRAGTFLRPAIAGLRDQGRLALVGYAQVSQAWAGVFTGNWDAARADAGEGIRLNREASRPIWLAAAITAGATVEGLRGNADRAEALAAEAEALLLPIAANPLLALVQVARGAAALGGGRYDDAYEQLRRVFDASDIAYHPYARHWIVADLVDAAVRTGHEAEARVAIGGLEQEAQQTRSPILNVGLAYARPLLADEEEAGTLFEAGLDADLVPWAFLRGRLLLAYGEWLRRRRRVAESRAPLRTAREALDALGAISWAERARTELRASGEVSRQREPGALDQLTPQELQIAQMAAQGLSNREIADQLYLSHRTIGFHLYHVFPKLGITSRGQLHQALEGPPVG